MIDGNIKRGECYEAAVNGTSPVVVVTNVVTANGQGNIGSPRYACRDIDGTTEILELAAKDLRRRVHLYEIVERFLKQGWLNHSDIIAYLLEYGMALKENTVMAYVAQFQRYGTCKTPTTTRVKSRPQNGPVDFDKLLQLKEVVEAVGGIPRTMTLADLIEEFGGVKRFRTALAALATFMS